MPGPKMGPRPADFNEEVIKNSPTYIKWNNLQDGERLRYACREFVKGHGQDEERLMRRIMIARRNNIRDHETLKRARKQNKLEQAQQQQQVEQPISEEPMKMETTTMVATGAVANAICPPLQGSERPPLQGSEPAVEGSDHTVVAQATPAVTVGAGQAPAPASASATACAPANTAVVAQTTIPAVDDPSSSVAGTATPSAAAAASTSTTATPATTIPHLAGVHPAEGGLIVAGSSVSEPASTTTSKPTTDAKAVATAAAPATNAASGVIARLGAGGVRRLPSIFSDQQVESEMDVKAVEATRSYRAWLALSDGQDFVYNQKYVKGREGHDWLLRKNIWRRMRYRRENKKLVERLKNEAAMAGIHPNPYVNNAHSTPAMLHHNPSPEATATSAEGATATTTTMTVAASAIDQQQTVTTTLGSGDSEAAVGNVMARAVPAVDGFVYGATTASAMTTIQREPTQDDHHHHAAAAAAAAVAADVTQHAAVVAAASEAAAQQASSSTASCLADQAAVEAAVAAAVDFGRTAGLADMGVITETTTMPLEPGCGVDANITAAAQTTALADSITTTSNDVANAVAAAAAAAAAAVVASTVADGDGGGFAVADGVVVADPSGTPSTTMVKLEPEGTAAADAVTTMEVDSFQPNGEASDVGDDAAAATGAMMVKVEPTDDEVADVSTAAMEDRLEMSNAVAVPGIADDAVRNDVVVTGPSIGGNTLANVQSHAEPTSTLTTEGAETTAVDGGSTATSAITTAMPEGDSDVAVEASASDAVEDGASLQQQQQQEATTIPSIDAIKGTGDAIVGDDDDDVVMFEI